MYWKLFDLYVSPDHQESRSVLDDITCVLTSEDHDDVQSALRDVTEILRDLKVDYLGTDYLVFVVRYIRKIKAYEKETLARTLGQSETQRRKEYDRKARWRVRFVSQAGILLQKRLVDKDLLFELLGPGLQIEYPILQTIVDAYRASHKVRVYREFEFLIERYNRWAGTDLQRQTVSRLLV